MAQASVVCHSSSVRPSVRQLRFLGNRCMDSDQILWEATYPPNLQTTCFLSFFFKILNFHIYFVFINMRPYGSQNWKTLLPQSLLNFTWFFSPMSSQSYFWNFEILNFYDFFSCSLTWGSYGGNEFLPSPSSQSYFFRFFKICIFQIVVKLRILTWESMGNHKMWNILKTDGRRAKWNKIWDSWC